MLPCFEGWVYHGTEVAVRVILVGLWIYFASLAPVTRSFSNSSQLVNYSFPFTQSPAISTAALAAAGASVVASVIVATFVIAYACKPKAFVTTGTGPSPFWRESLYCLYSSTLGITVVAVFTNALKTFVGRPRPDYLNRCYPSLFVSSSIPTIDLTNERIRQSPNLTNCDDATVRPSYLPFELVQEGRRSFPSGHSSYFAVLCTTAALYLLHFACVVHFGESRQESIEALLQSSSQQEQQARDIHSIFPLSDELLDARTKLPSSESESKLRRGILGACYCQGFRWTVSALIGVLPPVFCGATRVVDHRHHPTDVIAGLILGYVIGICTHSLYFGSTWLRLHSIQKEMGMVRTPMGERMSSLYHLPPSCGFILRSQEIKRRFPNNRMTERGGHPNATRDTEDENSNTSTISGCNHPNKRVKV